GRGHGHRRVPRAALTPVRRTPDRPPPSTRRGVAIAVGGALFTAVLWTLVTGEVERGAVYGAIVLGVLLASAALEQRRRP
ncbi:MAG TPA: hypothetical protein VN213_03825, partial [Solirubrobacteraceae bacterium]|nr:hypothetical protein [Solirubrobacteraceae bacterium]